MIAVKMTVKVNNRLTAVFLAACLTCATVAAIVEPRFHFEPSDINVHVTEGQTVNVTFNVLFWNQSCATNGWMFVQVEPSFRAEVLSNAFMQMVASDGGANETLTLKGISMGHAKLAFYWAADERNQSKTTSTSIVTTTTTTTTNLPIFTKLTTKDGERIMTNAIVNIISTSGPSNGSSTTEDDDLDFWEREDATTPFQTNRESSTELTTLEENRKFKQKSKEKKKTLSSEAFNESVKVIRNSESVLEMSAVHRVKRENGHLQEPLDLKPRILLSTTYHVLVLRRRGGIMDEIALAVLGTCIIVITLTVGCQVELPVIWQMLKKPTGPLVTFICQFAFMPLVSYGFGQVLLAESHLQFGLLLTTCLPGGIGPNMFTLILGGDINLSVTTTFISTLCSTIITALWMNTLGWKIIAKEGNKNNMGLQLFTSLVIFCVVPAVIGVLIQHFRPEWSKKTINIIKPLSVVMTIIFFAISGFTSTYLFALMTWRIIVTGLCVGCSGYAMATAIAWTCRLTRPQIIAVSINAAIQNVGTAFFLTQIILDQPDADLSSVVPVVQLMVTWSPLVIAYLLANLYKKIQNVRSRKSNKCVEELRRTNDIDAIEPLVINRTSISCTPGPPVPLKDRSRLTKRNNIDTATFHANMYNDYDDDSTYYDKAKPRVELRLSRDAGAKYDVPKHKMQTFDDDVCGNDKKLPTSQENLDIQD